MISSGGRMVSTSLSEWTAASISPSANHWSSSRVHSALPPISASGRSWILSPLAWTETSSMASSSQPWAAHNRARASCACAIASGDRLVPSRIGRSENGGGVERSGIASPCSSAAGR